MDLYIKTIHINIYITQRSYRVYISGNVSDFYDQFNVRSTRFSVPHKRKHHGCGLFTICDEAARRTDSTHRWTLMLKYYLMGLCLHGNSWPYLVWQLIVDAQTFVVYISDSIERVQSMEIPRAPINFNFSMDKQSMPSKTWKEITYPFPNFNGFTVKVWE